MTSQKKRLFETLLVENKNKFILPTFNCYGKKFVYKSASDSSEELNASDSQTAFAYLC